jgi:hypothetical protein
MAENIGEMALKITADARGLQSNLNQARGDVEKFTNGTREQAGRLASVFDSSSASLGRFIEGFRSGNLTAVAGELRGLALAAGIYRSQIVAAFQPVKFTPVGEATFTPVAQGAASAAGAVGGVGAAAATAGPAVLGFLKNLGTVGTIAVPVVAATAVITGGLVLLRREANAVTKEIFELSRFAGRLGTTTTGAQVLVRTFATSGIDREGAEFALNRFRSVLGEVHLDPTGTGGQTLRRLGLDPEEITRLDTEQAFRRVIVALGRVRNSFDQAHFAQALFSRGFQDLLPIIQRGEAGIDRVAGQVARFGDTPETIARAVEAQRIRREAGIAAEEAGGPLNQWFRDFATKLSLADAQATEAVQRWGRLLNPANLFFTPPPTPPPPPRPVAQQPTWLISAITDIARDLRADLPIIGEMTLQLVKQSSALSSMRAEAERLGFVRVGATRQEVEAVRPLLEMRQRLSILTGSSVLTPVLDAIGRSQIAAGAAGQAEDLARQWNDAAAAIGATAEELRAVRIAELEAQQAALGFFGQFMQGAINAAREADAFFSRMERVDRDLARIRQEGQEAEAVRLRVRSPLETFRDDTSRLAGNPQLSDQAFNRDLAARFQQAVSGLGQGPSSFGLTGTTSDSREGLLRADDFRIRGELDRDPGWARRQLEALRRQQEIQQQVGQEIVDALGGNRDAIVQAIEGALAGWN